MTLRELIAANPNAFYGQQWYLEEKFLDTPMPAKVPDKPPSFMGMPKKPIDFSTTSLPHAVTLAHLYLKFPEAPVWKKYLWCRDRDAKKQQVYIGAGSGKGLEIHRHLHLTGLWGYPTW